VRVERKKIDNRVDVRIKNAKDEIASILLQKKMNLSRITGDSSLKLKAQ
jgi:hypothetical protein